MKTAIATLITALTFNRVRFLVTSPDGRVQSLRWVWTPYTSRFAHGGFVFLSASWLWRFRRGA